MEWEDLGSYFHKVFVQSNVAPLSFYPTKKLIDKKPYET